VRKSVTIGAVGRRVYAFAVAVARWAVSTARAPRPRLQPPIPLAKLLAPAKEDGFGRALGDAEDGADLGAGEAAVLAQEECLALARREREEDALNLALDFAAQEHG